MENHNPTKDFQKMHMEQCGTPGTSIAEFSKSLSGLCVHGTQMTPKSMENHNPFIDLQQNAHWSMWDT